MYKILNDSERYVYFDEREARLMKVAMSPYLVSDPVGRLKTFLTLVKYVIVSRRF